MSEITIKEKGEEETEHHVSPYLSKETADELQHSSDKLSLLKFTAEVRSRIRNNISSDFTLCKLDDKNKDFIIEHTSTAYYCERIISEETQDKEWKWDDKTKKWNRTTPNEADLQEIKQAASKIFDTFMNRIFMITVLNRNVDKNHLLKILAGQAITEEEPETLTTTQKLKKAATETNEGETDK